jgi:hypothetical protein
MSGGNENVNDINSPVQTRESEIGEGALQVGTARIDAGKNQMSQVLM